jgi:hypothetical protein
MKTSFQSIWFGVAAGALLLVGAGEVRADILQPSIDNSGRLLFHWIDGATPGARIKWSASAKVVAEYGCPLLPGPLTSFNTGAQRVGTSTSSSFGQINVVIPLGPPPPNAPPSIAFPPCPLGLGPKKLRKVTYVGIQVTSQLGTDTYPTVSRTLPF